MFGDGFVAQDLERNTELSMLQHTKPLTLLVDSVVLGIEQLGANVKLYVILHAKMVELAHIQVYAIVLLGGVDPAALLLNVILAVQPMVESVLVHFSAAVQQD
jgi:hypothetical protein